MESGAYKVSLTKNPTVSISVMPGHFTTGNLHVSHYLDVSDLKANALVARNVARELAIPYVSSTLVDTIVCMERTDVIGAYLAEELLQEGTQVMNSGGEIHVVTPINSSGGKLIFFDNEVDWITNRHILVLFATISSGKTMRGVLECLAYYGGIVSGISSLFLSSAEAFEPEIHALFTTEDIPEYRMLSPGGCDMCKEGRRLDAIISSEGYTKIPNQ